MGLEFKMYKKVEVYKSLYEERVPLSVEISKSVDGRTVEDLVNDLLRQAEMARGGAVVHVVAYAKGVLRNNLQEARSNDNHKLTMKQLRTADEGLYYRMIGDDLCSIKLSPVLRNVFSF